MKLNGRPVLWRAEFNNEQSEEFGFLARSVEREVNGFFGRGKLRSRFIRCKVRKFRYIRDTAIRNNFSVVKIKMCRFLKVQ